MYKSHLTIPEDESAVVIEDTGIGDPSRRSTKKLGSIDLGSMPVPGAKGRQLLRSEVSPRLEMVGKTGDGQGYAYLKANLTNMALTDISVLPTYKFLQFVNVSQNKLTNESMQVLAKLPHLLLIQADQNLLTSAKLPRMEFLQVIIMNKNKMKSCADIFQPEMSTIELANNGIPKIDLKLRMETLQCLDLRNNLLPDLGTLVDGEFLNITNLYLANNKIKTLAGIDVLVNLKMLHVRGNPLNKLSGFSENMRQLEYINLRNCQVSSRMQVKKLQVLKGLKTLILRGCPYFGGAGVEGEEQEEDDPEKRVEVIATVPILARLNKADVTPEERAEAKELLKTWLEEEQPAEEDDEDKTEEEAKPDE